jgi:hypothetical protein
MSVDMNSVTGFPTLDKIYDYISFNPIIIIVLVIIIIFYFILFGSLGDSFSSSNSDNDLFDMDVLGGDDDDDDDDDEGSSSNMGIILFSIIIVGIFIVLILINGFNYFLNINIVTSIKNFFTKKPEINILADSELTNENTIVPEIKYIKQAYHIPNNKYTYEDAQALCKAYGSRLASYKEIENAYDKGADWCSYGWSEDQMALYPTQYKKWKKLQKIEGHEHDCGRPGINGGYIDNPNVRFGVNCYGHKPKITKLESEIMRKEPLYPPSQKELDFNNRVKHWKNKINDILIAPFNKNKWSRV